MMGIPWWTFLLIAFAVMVVAAAWLSRAPLPGGGRQAFSFRDRLDTWSQGAEPPSLSTPPQPPEPPAFPAELVDPQKAGACLDGSRRIELRYEVETDLHQLRRLQVDVAGAGPLLDLDQALAELRDGTWVVDVGELDLSATVPLKLGGEILEKLGFPDPGDVAVPGDNPALEPIRQLVDVVRARKPWGEWTLLCPAVHVHARCEETFVCEGGDWRSVERTLIVHAAGDPSWAAATPRPVAVRSWAGARRTLNQMADMLRARNQPAQAALEKCATRERG